MEYTAVIGGKERERGCCDTCLVIASATDTPTNCTVGDGGWEATTWLVKTVPVRNLVKVSTLR